MGWRGRGVNTISWRRARRVCYGAPDRHTERPMPRGPRGEWRPADMVGCAVRVGKIATGEIEEKLDEKAADEERPVPAAAE